MVRKHDDALSVRQRRDAHRPALAGPRKVDEIDRFERSVAVDAREPFGGCGVADRGADVGADDMAAEQADRRIIGDRDDIVGDAEERILFLIDPTREIGEIGRATSELQSLMRISYAVFCLKKKKSKIHSKRT